MAESPKSTAACRGLGALLPVQGVFARVGVPSGGRRCEGGLIEAFGGGKRVREKGGVRVAVIAGPPSDLDLLSIRRVTHDEVVRGRVGWLAGEQADGQVEGAPPRVDGRRTAAVRGAQGGEDDCGLRRSFEVGGDRGRVVAGVVEVFVEWCRPRRLLRPGIDVHRPDKVVDRGQETAGHLGEGSVGDERDAVRRRQRRGSWIRARPPHAANRRQGQQAGHRTARAATARTLDLVIRERVEGPILTRHDGKRLDARTAYRWVRSIGKQAGLERVHPHMPRAAFIMAALDAGVPLRDVQLAARDADPRTTTEYDRRRQNLDRHAAYAVVAFVTSGRRQRSFKPQRRHTECRPAFVCGEASRPS